MREIIRLGLILMLISAIAGAALAATHTKTFPIIEEQRAKALEANLRSLLPAAQSFELQEEGNEDKTFYLGYQGGEKVGVAAIFAQGGYGGPIKMMLGVNSDGVLTGLRIIEHSETPGLGAKVDEGWFKEQFENKSISDPFAVHEDIQAITGATITTQSVAGGIKIISGEIERTFLTDGTPVIDFSQVPDGVYEGEAQGFGGVTKVQVEIEGGRLLKVAILENHDTPDISAPAMSGVPERMVNEQKPEVDVVSGATFSSRGIIAAVTQALQDYAVIVEPTIEIAALPDGTYNGTAQGFKAPLEVAVSLQDGKIIAVEVLEHDDSPGISDSALEQIPERIIAEQGWEVDVVSGATFTSRGLMAAVEDALTGAAK
jgi:NosR/NirI family nitrous oxide reductase transcriptional regulator